MGDGLGDDELQREEARGNRGTRDGSDGRGGSELEASEHRISAVLAAVMGRVEAGPGREGEEQDEFFSARPSRAVSVSSMDDSDCGR